MEFHARQSRVRKASVRYGEAFARLQDSLFLDRDYWVLGNMEHRSQRSSTAARRPGAR